MTPDCVLQADTEADPNHHEIVEAIPDHHIEDDHHLLEHALSKAFIALW